MERAGSLWQASPAASAEVTDWLQGLFSGQGVWGQEGTPHFPPGPQDGSPLETQADPALALQNACLVAGLGSAPLQARPRRVLIAAAPEPVRGEQAR